MPWDRRFGVPIALLDGQTITTLSDAREVLLTVKPTARRGAVWRYLTTLLIDAAAGVEFFEDGGVRLRRVIK
jgi:hypothetical protein